MRTRITTPDRIKIKSSFYSLYYAKACGGVHLRDLALGNTASKERLSGGEQLVSDLTELVIEAQTSGVDSDVYNRSASPPRLNVFDTYFTTKGDITTLRDQLIAI